MHVVVVMMMVMCVCVCSGKMCGSSGILVMYRDVWLFQGLVFVL